MRSTLNSLKYGQARNVITREISLLRKAITYIDDALRNNNSGSIKLEEAAAREADKYIKQAHQCSKNLKISNE